MNMKAQWYVAKTGNHQRIIADENTGESIAVVYEAENADILAAAPDLLEAANEALKIPDIPMRHYVVIMAAIQKAKGEY